MTLRCPLCELEFKDRKDLIYHIWGGGSVLTEHNPLEIAEILSKMIAEKQEPSIPVKKIEEKIKELESEKFQLGWAESFEERRNKIALLKSLLPKK